jgi:hypothetical protein
MLRINVIIDRGEDPLVYDMLAAAPKGARRTFRLKVLLHDGAIAQIEWSRGYLDRRYVAAATDNLNGVHAQSQLIEPGAAGIFDQAIGDDA